MNDEYEKPGHALAAWLEKKGVTAYQLSKETSLPQSRISEVISGKRRITAETATHLAAFFGTTPEYWLSIQTKHDLNESSKDGAERQISWGELSLGRFSCQAYVLADERRVISASHVLKLFGIKSSAYAGGSTLAKLLDSPYLKSDRMNKLRDAVSKPVKFVNHFGTVTHGYEGETVVEVCKALMEVRRVGGMPSWAKDYVDAAEMVVISLAKVGIVALIDEATGHQEKRHREGLQRLFDVFMLKEYAAWAKRFPDEFYTQMFRLKGWKWASVSSQKPPIVGKITNEVVYQRLAPGILDELRRLNPILETGRRKVKHHQWMTADVGHAALNQYLFAVCALMRGSSDWRSFVHLLQLTFPKLNEGVQLELTDYHPHPETD